MISLTDIHESRGGAPVPEFAGVRVCAVGTGEKHSLARVVDDATGQGLSVLIRCCRGSLAAGSGHVGVGMCLEWDAADPARVEESPMQAIAVVTALPGERTSAGVYRRGSLVCRAFDDVAVAWLSGDDAALASRVAELVGCLSDESVRSVQHARQKIAYGARGAMDDHMAAPLTIPQLAEICATSPTVLKESFRGEFGLPVYEWYRRLRMLRASELLCEGAAAVGEVAAKVGYSNPSKFARAFCDCMGAAPSVFKQM
ncbi:AraC family transcriptional regulator [Paratractidigestivibacter sp.]|uniref:helix-turn-helix domain-containing protein n=1 Tax=Paratractidigestivibacter sp. TaxID=2847316 RepID=UPI002ABE73E2|nr:AraC family transcriptional regulator [Paratractidigestivibacter sp.]